MNTKYHCFVAGIAPHSEVKWGVNPEDPSLPELLWVANSCTLAVAADQPYNSAWGSGDERLPFVYQHWMDMGALSVAELQKQASTGASPTISPPIPAPALNPPVPPSPSTPPSTLQAQPGIPVVPGGQDDVAPVDAAPEATTNTKGKGKALPAASSDDMQGLGSEEKAEGKTAIAVHRHAPFTIEKQKTVLSMTYDFIDNLRRFAKEENLDPTAVVRVFRKQLGAAKLTSWQAYERLVSIERGGGSVYSLLILLLAL